MYDKYSLKLFVGKVADEKYYNEKHQIIRVIFRDKFFDFKYLNGHNVPGPGDICIITTTAETLEKLGMPDKELEYLPGHSDKNGNLKDLPLGYVYTMPNKQSSSTSNPNSAGASFSVSKTNTYNIENVKVAVAPPINRDYTINEGDNKNDSVGIFINDKGTVFIKSTGSSITMGEEGTYFSGNIHWESSEHTREWMMDNPLQRFIPSTIVSAPPSIPELPNIAKFAQFAGLLQKIRGTTKTISKLGNLL